MQMSWRDGSLETFTLGLAADQLLHVYLEEITGFLLIRITPNSEDHWSHAQGKIFSFFIVHKKPFFLPEGFLVAFLISFSHLALILTILMSLKMTDLSFLSCFASCLNNTGYRITCSPYIFCWQPKKSRDVGRDTDWRIPWRVST